ncbi:MAG: sigma-70 family RNA polymerase sigma factor [Bacteroidota bacterium]
MDSQNSRTDFLQQIRRGNQGVLQDLYRDHREPFVRWAEHKYPCTQSQLLDIFQDAVIVFYRNVAQGKLTELNSSPKTYLFAIGKNLIYKSLRRESRWEEIDETICEPLEIEREYESMEQKQLLGKALGELGDSCQQILKMFYYRNFAMQAIKEQLGYKSEAVARTKKKRCLQYLRKIVSEKYKNELEL